MGEENKQSKFKKFGDLKLDSIINDEKTTEEKVEKKSMDTQPEEKKQLPKKTIEKKSKSETSSTSITINTETLKTMQLYCKLEGIHFSTLVDNYFTNDFIPNKKVKSVIKKHFDNL